MSDGRADEDRYTVPALKRGLAILRSFDGAHRVLSMVELARMNDLPRATAFRLIHTLEAMDFLVREPGGQGFRLGPAVLGLGFGYLAGQPLPDIARPILQRLRDATGASTHLAIRDGAEIVYLVQVSGQAALTSNIGVGSRLPAHASTMGRALLMDLDRTALDALYPGGALSSATDKTPRTVAALDALLAEDRARGYIAGRSFYEAGVASVAAPVRNATGAIEAAVSLVASEHAVDEAAMHGPIKDQVLQAAAEIARWRGYAPAALPSAAE